MFLLLFLLLLLFFLLVVVVVVVIVLARMARSAVERLSRVSGVLLSNV